MSTLKSTILSAKDVPSELVEVPEWGVTVLVKGMSRKARKMFLEQFGEQAKAAAAAKERGEDPEAAIDGKVDADAFTGFLLTGFIYDPETDERLFDAADLAALDEKSAAAIDRLTSAAMRLSGLGQKAVDEAGKPSSDPGSTTTNQETDQS